MMGARLDWCSVGDGAAAELYSLSEISITATGGRLLTRRWLPRVAREGLTREAEALSSKTKSMLFGWVPYAQYPRVPTNQNHEVGGWRRYEEEISRGKRPYRMRLKAHAPATQDRLWLAQGSTC